MFQRALIFLLASLTTECVFAASSRSCTLPTTQNGIYIVECEDSEGSVTNRTTTSGEVSSSCEVFLKCDEGYAIENDAHASSVCSRSKWKPDIPQCKKTCRKLDTTGLNLLFQCFANGREVPCNSNLFGGSKVKLKCQQHYTPESQVFYNDLQCNSNGEWNHPLFACEPECGKVFSNPKPQISGGEVEKFGSAPWHVALYRKDNSGIILICGGTILSVRVILSAAHCVTRKNEPNIYEVLVAKVTRDYSKTDNHLQRGYRIRQIKVPEVYRGVETNFASDIALLILHEDIRLSTVVSPACVETAATLFDVKSGYKGKVSGWGLDDRGAPSETLLTANIPYFEYSHCITIINEDNVKNIELDKFCGGNITGPGIHQGDSGGGYLVQHPRYGLYYVRGVASYKFAESSSLALFTDVHNYIDWIQETIAEVKLKGISTSTVTGGYEPSSRPSSVDVNVPPPIVSPILPEDCGISNGHVDSVGTEKVSSLGHWPWIASFDSKEKFCTGCLIADRWILTSALCGRDIKNNKIKVAHLGDLHLNNNDDGATPIDVPIDKVIQHYNYEFGLLGNNIALIKLIRSATFNKNIQPICIPSDKEYRKGSFYADKPAVHIWYNNRDKMYQEVTTTHDSGECHKILNAAGEIEENEVCTDSCTGGVATSLVMQVPQKNTFHVVGFWSYYMGSECSKRKTFFIKVAQFSTWIKDTIAHDP